MKRFGQIRALTDDASRKLIEIEDVYSKSLSAKELDLQILVLIKNFLENLRSALDFLAREISDRFCNQPAGNRPIDVYFPILRRSSSARDFGAFMNGRFPGLRQSHPSLYSKLESYQFYKSASNEWIVQFNELCTENKHKQLSPQIRREQRETRLTEPDGGTIGWNEGVQFGPGGRIVIKPGGRLRIGPGGSVEIGTSRVSILGRPVDPVTRVPMSRLGGKLGKIVWVDFVFSAIGVSALPFLKTCLSKVKAIVDEIEAEIESASS